MEEVEKLRNDVLEVTAILGEIELRHAKIRAEAIKEFAENLKKDIQNHSFEVFMNGMKGTPRTNEITYETVFEYIDELVEEMTRGKI